METLCVKKGNDVLVFRPPFVKKGNNVSVQVLFTYERTDGSDVRWTPWIRMENSGVRGCVHAERTMEEVLTGQGMDQGTRRTGSSIERALVDMGLQYE